ncbi:hypothetical protein [Paenibacillus sp. 7516]|uniref:hypothetical protein n=1 Tax=Paenibacillus sp. 7516 TaxID=2022549 RepID=UPI000BA75449|nr:hypothetical protein [Paenibacillus sp. 7516]PAF31307.1 hypothetical protein CHI14_12340 [Paenibacillus sp. 7516]
MKNRTVAYWLLLINAINLFTLVAYPYMLIISFYMFASSNTDDYILEYIAAGVLATYPVPVLASFTCWAFYKNYKFKTALVMANLILIWVAILLLASLASTLV